MKKIENEQNLKSIMDILGNEIVRGIYEYNIFSNLMNELKLNEQVFYQAPVFWKVTLDKYRDSIVIAICRIYDREKNAISLINFVESIDKNSSHFSNDKFKERLRDNPFVEQLLDIDRNLNHDIIRQHREILKSKENLIKKIFIWRNNYYAHKGQALYKNKSQVLENNPIMKEEYKNLLDVAYDIFKYYYYLLFAVHWSTHIIGEDDYEKVIKYIKYGLEKYKENSYKFL